MANQPTLRAAIEAILATHAIELGAGLGSLGDLLTAALAKPDAGDGAPFTRKEWQRMADVMGGASDQSPEWTMDDEIAAKCRAHAEPETGEK